MHKRLITAGDALFRRLLDKACVGNAYQLELVNAEGQRLPEDLPFFCAHLRKKGPMLALLVPFERDDVLDGLRVLIEEQRLVVCSQYSIFKRLPSFVSAPATYSHVRLRAISLGEFRGGNQKVELHKRCAVADEHVEEFFHLKKQATKAAVEPPTAAVGAQAPTDDLGDLGDLAELSKLMYIGFPGGDRPRRVGQPQPARIAAQAPVVDRNFALGQATQEAATQEVAMQMHGEDGGGYDSPLAWNDGDSEESSNASSDSPDDVPDAALPPPARSRRAAAQAKAPPAARAVAPPAAQAAAPPAPQAEAPPAAPPVPPPPPEAVGAERPARKRRAVEAGMWHRISMVHGELVFEERTGKINAHCNNPLHVRSGVHCHTDRLTSAGRRRGCEGQGRPLGFLYAWLLESSDFSTKADHQAAKRELGSEAGFHRRVDARRRLRAMAIDDDRLQALFDRERAATAEEAELDGEPLRVM